MHMHLIGDIENHGRSKAALGNPCEFRGPFYGPCRNPFVHTVQMGVVTKVLSPT